MAVVCISIFLIGFFLQHRDHLLQHHQHYYVLYSTFTLFFIVTYCERCWKSNCNDEVRLVLILWVLQPIIGRPTTRAVLGLTLVLSDNM